MSGEYLCNELPKQMVEPGGIEPVAQPRSLPRGRQAPLGRKTADASLLLPPMIDCGGILPPQKKTPLVRFPTSQKGSPLRWGVSNQLVAKKGWWSRGEYEPVTRFRSLPKGGLVPPYGARPLTRSCCYPP